MLTALTIICSIILCVPVGGIVIGMLTAPLLPEIERSVEKSPDDPTTTNSAVDGLKNGGRYIGWLERSLVLLLVLEGETGGVGFLIAAKSILRFGDVKEPGQRRRAEYVIIGTFLSFGWALLIAFTTVRVLAML